MADVSHVHDRVEQVVGLGLVILVGHRRPAVCRGCCLQAARVVDVIFEELNDAEGLPGQLAEPGVGGSPHLLVSERRRAIFVVNGLELIAADGAGIGLWPFHVPEPLACLTERRSRGRGKGGGDLLGVGVNRAAATTLC